LVSNQASAEASSGTTEKIVVAHRSLLAEHTGRLAGAHWPLGQEHSRDWIRLLALVAKHAALLARTAGERIAWARPPDSAQERHTGRPAGIPGQPIVVPRHTCSCSQYTPKEHTGQ